VGSGKAEFSQIRVHTLIICLRYDMIEEPTQLKGRQLRRTNGRLENIGNASVHPTNKKDSVELNNKHNLLWGFCLYSTRNDEGAILDA